MCRIVAAIPNREAPSSGSTRVRECVFLRADRRDSKLRAQFAKVSDIRVRVAFCFANCLELWETSHELPRRITMSRLTSFVTNATKDRRDRRSVMKFESVTGTAAITILLSQGVKRA